MTERNQALRNSGSNGLSDLMLCTSKSLSPRVISFENKQNKMYTLKYNQCFIHRHTLAPYTSSGVRGEGGTK